MSDDPTEFTDEVVETGFVTAAVTAPDGKPEDMDDAAVQAAKALVKLPDISPVALAQLAREIAQDIGLLPAILTKHKLTQPQYEFLETHNKFFKAILAQEIQNWQSIKSTEVRLRLQAQAALEQQMPVIGNRMGNAAEKLSDVVEAAKFFARVAGVDAPPPGALPTGERYQITIDLGAGSDVVIAAKSAAPAGAVAPAAGEVPRNAEASSNPAALRRNGEEPRALPALRALPEG